MLAGPVPRDDLQPVLRGGWGAFQHNHGQSTNVLSAATAVASTGSHSCAIRADGGAVVCWGYDGDGQATPPASLDGITGKATAISAGGFHSLAIQAPEPGAAPLAALAFASLALLRRGCRAGR